MSWREGVKQRPWRTRTPPAAGLPLRVCMACCLQHTLLAIVEAHGTLAGDIAYQPSQKPAALATRRRGWRV